MRGEEWRRGEGLGGVGSGEEGCGMEETGGVGSGWSVVEWSKCGT